MDRELKLNSIDRYVKSSPRFVLEEHGHCEVPAGCGGVVLRWRDPRTSVPVRIRLALLGAASAETAIDGVPPSSSRPLLAPGEHALTITAVAEPGAQLRLLLAVRADSVRNGPWLLRTAPDSTWRWTSQEPAQSWSLPGFDDSKWESLVSAQPVPEQEEYKVRRLRESGAEPLTAVPGAERVWIRAVFEVPAEGGDGGALCACRRADGGGAEAAGPDPAVLRVAGLRPEKLPVPPVRS